MIGIFDSGLGGLTVVREIFRKLPGLPIIYFGDTARTPYGAKSKETITKYALENAEFLINKGARILVVACNTVSSCAIDVLKEKFKMPIFDVITPAAKKAAEITNGRVGVIGTRATISSGVYEEKIFSFTASASLSSLTRKSSDIKIFSQPCPLFVSLVEENWINKPETKMIARRYLSGLKAKQIDTLILGCTHYPFLKNIIQQKIGRRVKIVDSAEEVVKNLKEFIEERKIEFEKIENEFFVSDLTPYLQSLSSKWLEVDVKIGKIAF